RVQRREPVPPQDPQAGRTRPGGRLPADPRPAADVGGARHQVRRFVWLFGRVWTEAVLLPLKAVCRTGARKVHPGNGRSAIGFYERALVNRPCVTARRGAARRTTSRRGPS